MMKKVNVKLLMLTSLMTLLPIIIGGLFWDRLPEMIPTHFGLDGTADGYSSKFQALVTLPLILVLVHILVVVVTAKDPKADNVTPKMRLFVYGFIPVLSILVQSLSLGYALGFVKDTTKLVFMFLGVIFLILGNYLPKIKQNYTVGIKIPWTLHDEENWNKTHRLAGKLWVLGGLLILIDAWFGFALPVVFFGSILLMIAIPTVYSYLLSKES